MSLRSRLAKIIVGKRDPREEEIKVLLDEAKKIWEKDTLNGEDYLKEAIKIKKNISHDRGIIYFEKYPEISNQIDEVKEELNIY